ncbi:MAG: MAPEG family protein [Proteobacteria bacterium]|nr:MAPEG family protein [Pseudomonadota bacterium]
MDFVIIVVVLALIQYIAFAMLVGRARGKYDVKAPATSGDPVFERYFRVQQNTLEQLAIFLPAIFLLSYLGNPMYAAGFGVVYLIGRMIYLRSYVKDPGSRGLGFMLTFLPSVLMLIGALFMAGRNLLAA